MNLEEERQDDEKNRCVNKLLDICLSLTPALVAKWAMPLAAVHAGQGSFLVWVEA